MHIWLCHALLASGLHAGSRTSGLHTALLKHWAVAPETSLSSVKSSKTTQGSEFGVFSIGVSAGWDV